jgi:hypothetical protein
VNPQKNIGKNNSFLYHWTMGFPIKVCAVCSEEFELKPGKPGFANRCPACSEEESDAKSKPADVLKADKGANAARREAMRNLLYRKDS